MTRTWKQGLMAAPGVGASLLPKLACPLCWPAYTALLSSVGLGFLVTTRYLMPVTAAFLALAVASLAIRAHRRHGYAPFLLGLLAAAGVLLAKFWWESNPATYASVALLLVASVWNVWPLRAVAPDCCAGKQIS